MDEPSDLRELLATFYNKPIFRESISEEVIFTTPYHDGFGFGMFKTSTLLHLVWSLHVAIIVKARVQENVQRLKNV